MSSEIINTTVEEYKKLVESLHSENYEMMVDLTVVDWFRKKEPRFEVVVQFLSISKNQRKTIKVWKLLPRNSYQNLPTHMKLYNICRG